MSTKFKTPPRNIFSDLAYWTVILVGVGLTCYLAHEYDHKPLPRPKFHYRQHVYIVDGFCARVDQFGELGFPAVVGNIIGVRTDFDGSYCYDLQSNNPECTDKYCIPESNLR